MLEKRFSTDAYRINPSSLCDGACEMLRKEANVIPDSLQYFKSMATSDGKVYLLVIGMTDSYYYGPNKNGDFFRGPDLKKYYKRFEESGVFWNHDNKDMNKSSGRVLKSFWNEEMHRVELIIEIPREKARYIPDYIETKKPISVSMGLRTPYELCSICGHKTVGSYANRCEHLKFMINKILDDGRKVYAISGVPYNLFDISIVYRPADRIAYALATKM